MDTKIPDEWKDLRLELKDPVKMTKSTQKEPVKYKTYKALINDYEEYYNKPKKNTGSNRSKIPYTDVGKCKLPRAKCSIQ